MNKRKEVFHGLSQHHSGMSAHTLLGLGVETGTNHLDTCQYFNVEDEATPCPSNPFPSHNPQKNLDTCNKEVSHCTGYSKSIEAT